MLIDAALCLQSQFEDCTFCIAIQGYRHCMPFDEKLAWTIIDRKAFINVVLLILQGKAKLSMASCLNTTMQELTENTELDTLWFAAVNSQIKKPCPQL